MMKYLIIVIIAIAISSCQQTKEKLPDISLKEKNNTEKASLNESKPAFNFADFKIEKGRLGPIKIGMTIEQAEVYLKGLTKETGDASDFGFCGGSPSYIYSFGKEPVMVLIPTLDTDTTLYIIATHEKLRTASGLHPNSTVAELVSHYSDMLVNQDVMNGWEYSIDNINNWSFVFTTNEDNLVGEYLEMEMPSKPKNLLTKTDWITIR